MAEFKAGDKVRVKTNLYGLDMEAGSVHVIDQVIDHPTDYPFAIRHNGENFRFHADELELITPQKEETVALDHTTRRKYTGDTVIVERNHELHGSPESFAYIKRAEQFTERCLAFDVREVPEVIKALQSVYDDYQQMLEDAKPKVEDILNGLGVGAVIRTTLYTYVKKPDGNWTGLYNLNHTAKEFGDTMDSIEILSEGVHLD